MAATTTPDTYITDEAHSALVAALTALDRDPAHPHPLADRITFMLGEIGGVWPESINPDALEQAATSPGDQKATQRYRKTLDANRKAMTKLRRIKPRT